MNLSEYLESTAAKKYSPGKHDCALFIAGWVDHVSGTSFTETLATTYTTAFSGLRRHAPDGLMETIRRHLLATGWREVPAADLQHGDIVVTDKDHPGIYYAGSIHTQPLGITGSLIMHISHAKGGFTWPRL